MHWTPFIAGENARIDLDDGLVHGKRFLCAITAVAPFEINICGRRGEGSAEKTAHR